MTCFVKIVLQSLAYITAKISDSAIAICNDKNNDESEDKYVNW